MPLSPHLKHHDGATSFMRRILAVCTSQPKPGIIPPSELLRALAALAFESVRTGSEQFDRHSLFVEAARIAGAVDQIRANPGQMFECTRDRAHLYLSEAIIDHFNALITEYGQQQNVQL